MIAGNSGVSDIVVRGLRQGQFREKIRLLEKMVTS